MSVNYYIKGNKDNIDLEETDKNINDYYTVTIDPNGGEPMEAIKVKTGDILTNPERPDFEQVTTMLDIAFKKHKKLNGLIFHSDQGWQYQMKPYRNRLSKKGIKQSMSRKGNCYDNCVMEIFFGTMKNEMFCGHEYEFKSLEELEKVMRDYIDYYNNERIITKLKGLTPTMYRRQSLNAVILN